MKTPKSSKSYELYARAIMALPECLEKHKLVNFLYTPPNASNNRREAFTLRDLYKVMHLSLMLADYDVEHVLKKAMRESITIDDFVTQGRVPVGVAKTISVLQKYNLLTGVNGKLQMDANFRTFLEEVFEAT